MPHLPSLQSFNEAWRAFYVCMTSAGVAAANLLLVLGSDELLCLVAPVLPCGSSHTRSA